MELNSLDTERQKRSVIVLANAAEIGSSVIKDIAGNDIANSINNSTITRDVIQMLVMQRITKKLIATNKA